MEGSDQDAQRVRQSWRACLVAVLLAGVAVVPWLAYSFLTPPGEAGEQQRTAWALLFYSSGVPLLIISGVFYVTALVHGCKVIRRRPVVWSWFIVSWAVLIGWAIFATTVLD
jgi:hypothetical protein